MSVPLNKPNDERPLRVCAYLLVAVVFYFSSQGIVTYSYWPRRTSCSFSIWSLDINDYNFAPMVISLPILLSACIFFVPRIAQLWKLQIKTVVLYCIPVLYILLLFIGAFGQPNVRYD